MKYPSTFYSWTILSETHAVKQLDKSAFTSGTGIPKEMQSFFGVDETTKLPKTIYIAIKNGRKMAHPVTLERINDRLRLRWGRSISGQIYKRFPSLGNRFLADETVPADERHYMMFNNEYSVYEVSLHKTLEDAIASVSTHKIEHMFYTDYEQYLSDNMSASLKLPKVDLDHLTAKAPKIPKKVLIKSIIFDRSSHVIAASLLRANGICERCGNAAPFIRKDGTPYLEVHHKIRLADGGEDSLENTIAVCPNCHRELHYGI